MTGFYKGHKNEQLFKKLYGLGERRLKIRDFCMDLGSCLKVYNLIVIQLSNTKHAQMANLDVIVYMVVSIYRLDKICNSTQSLAQPQSGLYRYRLCAISFLLR